MSKQLTDIIIGPIGKIKDFYNEWDDDGEFRKNMLKCVKGYIVANAISAAVILGAYSFKKSVNSLDDANSYLNTVIEKNYSNPMRKLLVPGEYFTAKGLMNSDPDKFYFPNFIKLNR